MTRRFFSLLILALAGLLAAPVLSRADMTNLALAKSGILESNVAYLRVSHVAAGLPDEIGAANRALTATNKIAGTVLDLRFADGDDVAAATATARFVGRKKAAAGDSRERQNRRRGGGAGDHVARSAGGADFRQHAGGSETGHFRRGEPG